MFFEVIHFKCTKPNEKKATHTHTYTCTFFIARLASCWTAVVLVIITSSCLILFFIPSKNDETKTKPKKNKIKIHSKIEQKVSWKWTEQCNINCHYTLTFMLIVCFWCQFFVIIIGDGGLCLVFFFFFNSIQCDDLNVD